uniref:Ubiquitin carboxyl-terminal hydrolase n=1 Tax=Oncorhynchus tshawytscha TaxID=74940 RepID=A0A8C8K1P1_ONCTS
MDGQRWLPLEANPDVMNQFLRQLGLLPTWQFGDVYGMDPELLSMVPRPVCAVLLLFPVTEKYESFRLEEEAKIKAQGQDVSPDVYFMKQTIGNACGTIGLIHAVANNQEHLEFETDSPLKMFLVQSTKLSPENKATFLEKDESIRVTHESSAQEGQTEAPSLDEKVDLHFIAFVNVGGHLYELAFVSHLVFSLKMAASLSPLPMGKHQKSAFLRMQQRCVRHSWLGTPRSFASQWWPCPRHEHGTRRTREENTTANHSQVLNFVSSLAFLLNRLACGMMTKG